MRFYLPDHARYDYLLNLPEQADVAKKIKEAMLDIEKYKPELDGVLPKDDYIPLTRTDKTIPSQLLKNFSNIPRDASGDMLGKIYEYFLGKFALARQWRSVFYAHVSGTVDGRNYRTL